MRSNTNGSNGGGAGGKDDLDPVPVRLAAPGIVLAIALLGGVGGCTTIAPEIEQAPAAVANAEAAVKGALIEALGVDGAAVGVAVADGRVTLDGFVADEAQRERALDAARAAADGMSVVDALQVRR